MPDTVNLADEIERHLPSELVDFMRRAGKVAARRGQRLYLVGGVVRDIMLGKPNLDLDLVVDKDAIGLATELSTETQARITTHKRFNTAKLRAEKWSADIATMRSETYERPGALPKIGPGTLATDVARRDFTINAMAVDLAAGRYGRLIDGHGGRDDLKRKYIRVLHQNSFVDDATRMWRAVRYEQRLGFRLEAETRRLLMRDLPMLDTISGDRIRHELERVLGEDRPEKVLRRAGQLGVLGKMHRSLEGNGWLSQRFRRARKLSGGGPLSDIYLALLAYRLSEEDVRELLDHLRLPKASAQTLEDGVALRSKLYRLGETGLRPSQIYNLLKDYSAASVMANRLAMDSSLVQGRLALYLNKLRYLRPVLTGNDLTAMGVQPGPQMKEILRRLLEARLDGEITTREGEVEVVRGRNPAP